MVRPGYKLTDIGEIPDDWAALPIEEFSTTRSGTTPSRSQQDKYFGGEYNWVKTLDLNNSIISDTEERVTKDALNETVLEVFPAGTVLVAMYGGFRQIGRTGILSVPAAVNQAISAILVNKELYNPGLLLFQLNYRIGEWRKVASSSRKDPNITGKDVKAFKVAVPPTITEQNRIAETLSDVDELIDALGKLIAKKRDLKTATMQQLLTGKKRLPGFGGDWTEFSLGNISSFITKGATPTTYGFKWQSSGVLFLKSECVSARGLDLTQTRFISDKAHRFLDRGEITSGDLLITITGNVGRVILLPDDFGVANINQHIARIRIVSDDVDKRFVYQYLSQSTVRKHFETIVTGLAYPQISLVQVRDALIRLPDLEEQSAIADNLTDMDEEIVALEARLAKTKAIKKGMMQELLTGRTRLI